MMSTSLISAVCNNNFSRIIGGTVLILLVPLVAMQLTEEVMWGPEDFVAAGILLLATGFTYELITKKARKLSHRIIVGAVLAVLLLLVWAELAVGLFGTPFAGS